MNELEDIEAWYRAQCDGDWEHSWGVTIGTLDNPGWSLEVNLVGTSLEEASFEPLEHRIGEDSNPDDEDWYVCKVENKVFKGFGGPYRLKTILQKFLEWQKNNG
jgi:hypothetical protein